MSLAEVLGGPHWESECHSCTTGTGPMWIDDLLDRPPWAAIYLIKVFDEEWWEIGKALDFDEGVPSRMPRSPILSCTGLGIPVDFAVGLKQIWFADAAPAALKRYMKRLERETDARTWETAQQRAQAWARLCVRSAE